MLWGLCLTCQNTIYNFPATPDRVIVLWRMQLICTFVLSLSKRAAIGEQKRLQNKKVLSQKKAFRRGRDSYDWASQHMSFIAWHFLLYIVSKLHDRRLVIKVSCLWKTMIVWTSNWWQHWYWVFTITGYDKTVDRQLKGSTGLGKQNLGRKIKLPCYNCYHRIRKLLIHLFIIPSPNAKEEEMWTNRGV